MIKKLHYFLMIVSLLCLQGISAQGKTVSGTVTDDSGTPLPGVNVIEKGTTNGTSADFDGNFSIAVSDNAVLVFSSIGFISKEIVVGNQTTINVSLNEDTEQLGEVVVTALGIKREKKALGFAIQEIKGAEIVGAKENNLSNSLSGKIAGLQVVRGSNGPASSSKLVLRGFNSLSENNEPLIVIDGVPFDNFRTGTQGGFFNGGTDRGNGLLDLNPDSIESITVLKGGSAAALYGVRAGNGVVLITTKTGKATPGVGITYSSSLGISNFTTSLERQSIFGQGNNGQHDFESSSNWGPRIEGQQLQNYAGVTEPLRHFDNVDAFFGSGINQTHNLSFQQQVTDATSVYTSLSYLNDDSIIPEATFERLNLIARTVSNFGPKKRWTTDFKVEYINSIADNRPITGVTPSNSFSSVFNMPNTINIRDFEQTEDELGNIRWWTDANQVNPYWAAQNNLNNDDRRRFLLNGALKYKFTDWLNGEIRAGADMHRTRQENRLRAGSSLGPEGRYSIAERNNIETNYSFLLTAQKDDLFGKFGVSGNLGGNLLFIERTNLNASAGALDVPNVFNLNNGVNSPTVNENGFFTKKINSLFGTVQFNYDGYLFVEATGRNDWTSTLPEENRSFFYPSISGTWVVSDMITNNGGSLPKWLTFAKLRASYAEVGNDADPFQLDNPFNIGKDPNDVTVASLGNTLNNPELKNELVVSKEVGLDLRFFNNRIGLDATYYRTNTFNQIIALPGDPFSGFASRRINAGDVQNEGIELQLNADIFQNPQGFSWNVNFNYSTNDNTLVSLAEGVDRFPLATFDRLLIRATDGGRYGDLYGTRFLRVQDETDPNFGRIVVDSNGIPRLDDADQEALLGNQQADALLGLTNTFGYKGFTLSLLFDARIGGEIVSGSNRSGQINGIAAETVRNGARDPFVFNGVVEVDGSPGEFVENTIEVEPEIFYNGVNTRGGNLGIIEQNVYDATNFRLRTVSLNYRLPSKWLKNTGLQGASLGLTMNNVWLISSNLNGIDPDSVFNAAGNGVGFENGAAPTVKTTFFNVAVNF